MLRELLVHELFEIGGGICKCVKEELTYVHNEKAFNLWELLGQLKRDNLCPVDITS